RARSAATACGAATSQRPAAAARTSSPSPARAAGSRSTRCSSTTTRRWGTEPARARTWGFKMANLRLQLDDDELRAVEARRRELNRTRKRRLSRADVLRWAIRVGLGLEADTVRWPEIPD